MSPVHRFAIALALVAASAAPAARAGAQVGNLPEQSPFRDLEYRQELAFFGGWYKAGRDPARVAPRDGPMFGVRYDLRIGGPAYFTARLAHVSSERTVIDPRLAAPDRVLGEESWSIALADVGIALNLTGMKSWHGLVPVVQGGLGVASDFKGGADAGTWRFGTPFLLTLGAGVKWVSTSRFQIRGDITNNMYQIKYPGLYYQPSADGSAVLEPDQARSVWKANWAFTLGGSYLFFR
ncbi:MAG TPA: hypothetical protein VFG84_11655 [Gemmatimonadaceae bacterium]|nr:hypothetical protein [Gemmatimonadaceae bacterium]